MKSIFQVAFIAALFGARCTANAFQTTPTAVRLENGSVLYMELSKTVDAKKAKVGDPVTAVLIADVLSHGKIAIRHDAKVVGHVTEVQPQTKEIPESRLGIVFDKVLTKGGDVAFQSLLLAIRPAQHPAFDVPKAPSPMGGSSSATTPIEDRHYPSPKGPNLTPRMNSSLGDELKSHDRKLAGTGPTDIDGLSLNSPANGGAQAIVSMRRTVKLESGIGIELRITGQ
jgi:hypothetical protein